MKTNSLYIHIPFCQDICAYCDFCKVFYQEKIVDEYLKVLKEELDSLVVKEPLKTIYIGGGTPSSLNYQQLSFLMAMIKPYLSDSLQEVCIEVNPESIDDKITYVSEQIKYYEDIGCKDSDILSVCEGSIGYNSTWLKPLVKAYVSSAYGYRSFNGGSFHNGIDLAGISEGTPIYSIGTGVVRAVRNAKKIKETTGVKSCGGNLIYIEYNILGKTYTAMYAHVLDIYVSVGDKVTANTIVATVGGGSSTWSWDIKGQCTTGTHLHFQLSDGVNTTVSSANANSVEPPGYPNKGVWFYSRTQWFA